jgi:hypothetical protein
MIPLDRPTRRRKPELSAHQKQMRFLTGLVLVVGLTTFAVAFWFYSRAGHLAGFRW